MSGVVPSFHPYTFVAWKGTTLTLPVIGKYCRYILYMRLWPHYGPGVDCDWHNCVPGLSPGGKGGRYLGLTTLPPSCGDWLGILGASNIWSPKGCRSVIGHLSLCTSLWNKKQIVVIKLSMDVNGSVGFLTLWQLSHYDPCPNLMVVCVSENRDLQCWYTYLLTPWLWVLLEKLTGFQLVKKFPTFYGTIRKFLPAVPFLRQLEPIHATTSHYLKIHLYIILSSKPWFSRCLFSFTKTLFTSLLSPICATCPTYLILLHLFTRIVFGKQYRSLSSSLRSFIHSPVTWPLLGPNIPLSTLFSNTLSSHFSLNMSDQVSHPYRTTGKIIVLYILLFAGPCGSAV